MAVVKRIALAVLFAVVAIDCASHTAVAATASPRNVPIDMVDTAFHPQRIEVKKGETVRFLFTNKGKLAHDGFIGDQAAQADHEREMREADRQGHGGHGGAETHAITLEPGETGELTYTVEDSDTLEVGCHQPGHYKAGMKVALVVV